MNDDIGPRACGDGTRRELELFERSRAGDQQARDELIRRFLPLARSIALRYERTQEPLEDLVQVASLALVKAVDRFDPDRGHAFSSLAVPTIAGEIKRHFRDRTWAVRPPRDLQELGLQVDRAVTSLTQQLERSPTISEVAEAVGRDDEDVLEAMQSRGARSALSFHAPRAEGEDEDATLADRVGLPEEGFEQAELRAMLDDLVGSLSPREEEILRLRFQEDMTQAEIGAIVGISQMQTSRIIRRALDRLRTTAELRWRHLTAA